MQEKRTGFIKLRKKRKKNEKKYSGKAGNIRFPVGFGAKPQHIPAPYRFTPGACDGGHVACHGRPES